MGPDRQDFLLSTSRPVLEPTQTPPVCTGTLSPVVERPGRESDHSYRISAEDKNTWIYTALPSIHLHNVVLT
jgi:hypothetical protein